MAALQRLLAILYKEVLYLGRDRLTFGMIFGIPVMQIILFGYAINTDVRELRAAVADQAGTALSRQLLAELEASQVLRIDSRAASGDELQLMLDTGQIHVGVLIPPDFGRRLQQGERPAVQLLVDGSDPIILSTARTLTSMPFEFDTRARQERAPPLFEVRNFYNPERRSSVFVVPGLIGVILTMTMVMFTAVAVVREREGGNLELLINTPVSSLELMIGKILPYVLIGLIQVSLITGLGALLFHVPVNGSLGNVYLASLLFIASNLGLGLMISTLVGTQFQAIQLTFFFFLPSILLSGFMFPFDGMPLAARWIAEGLPLTHFVRLIRGIMLRGADLVELWPEVLALLGFFVLTMGAAVLRFHKRLD
ncbi:transport permease protein [Marinobacterium nitratireducens]|uniref:Transport permease protein n=1 Tax=Marinobacterium nitratireducens TaxID=518897 RepID=A0A917Z8P4_9GAMM|nr:ABC transporter permease [Marinobacterium nitratireducens]GGO78210.1 transport permease protein [Marinobacterium nitratireducens]